MPETVLFTIGYQGRTLDQFLSILDANNIEAVMDVRYAAWSHKPGFKRFQLAKALDENQVKYAHYRELGALPGLRRQLKETGDWNQFAEAYQDYLGELNGTLEASLMPFEGKRVCLLCMEADPKECHRSLLANQIIEMGVASELTHL